MGKIAVLIRSLNLDDQNLIYNSWLKGYGDSYFAYGIPKAIYYEVHAALITGLLQSAKVLVACNPDDETHIFGFLAYFPSYTQRKFIVHYVYVKSSYKRLGIATALKIKMQDEEDLDDAPIVATHLTAEARFLKKWGVVYNPYILFSGGSYGYAKGG